MQECPDLLTVTKKILGFWLGDLYLETNTSAFRDLNYYSCCENIAEVISYLSISEFMILEISELCCHLMLIIILQFHS